MNGVRKLLPWLVTLAFLAIAQRPAAAAERSGFVLGVSLGPGVVVTNDDSARAFPRVSGPNLKIGAMVRPDLALVLYVPTGIHFRGGAARAFEGLMATAQFWVTERVWLLGGAGAQLDFPVIGTEPKGFYAGPGLTFGAGVDLGKAGPFTVDVGARVLGGMVWIDGSRRDGVAADALLGINWY